MMIAHKITLNPNDRQRTYCARAAGVSRFAYNWALSEWQRQYKEWKEDSNNPKPSQQLLRKQLNKIKRERFPWMLKVTKNAPQMAIIQLGQAFQNFFAGRARYPRFRKKGVHDRFSLTNDQFEISGLRIRIPNLGWVRMREQLRFDGKIMSAVISRTADKWFASIAVETQDSHLPKAENQGVVGVDLGVSSLATLSTGEKIEGPKPLKALLNRLRRCSRGLSRKVKGSKNREKAKRKLSKMHYCISCVRHDGLHKLTTDLTGRFHTIGIEDLNVKGLQRNRRLSRSISDMGLYEFRRQLEYKANMRGGLVVVADRFFASSKTCSVCDYELNELPLSVRQWRCPACGTEHDRDVNAAVNLKENAVSSTASACGEEGSGRRRKAPVKPASVKQEVNGKPVSGQIQPEINRFA